MNGLQNIQVTLAALILTHVLLEEAFADTVTVTQLTVATAMRLTATTALVFVSACICRTES